MNSKVFAWRHPYIFVALLLVTVMVLAVIGAVLLSRLGWWRRVGFRRSERPRLHFLLWLPLCPILIWNISQIQVAELVSPSRALLWLGLTAIAAFVEEVFYRGLMIRALEPRGLWKAAMLPALLFGATHVFNRLSGFDWGIVAGQVVYATAIGFAYSAYALNTGLLWPVIIVHALANFADLIDQEVLVQGDSPGQADLIRWSIYAVIFIGYGIWLLLRTTPPPAHTAHD